MIMEMIRWLLNPPPPREKPGDLIQFEAARDRARDRASQVVEESDKFGRMLLRMQRRPQGGVRRSKRR